MLFLISSAPDTKEFKTAYKLAKDMNADVCLLQSAVYASRSLNDSSLHIMLDDLQMRGIREDEITGMPIDYGELVDLMASSDKVVGIF
jgi:sulfur relay protein TusB/DsrH